MNPSGPFLSILLVNYNGLAHLEECLASVFGQDYRDFEVVMVDNASGDGSTGYVGKRFPEVRIVQAGANLGFAGGNNLGISHCRGRHVFFLNNDTRLETGALGNIADSIGSHPECRVFACLMLRYDNPALVDSAGDTLYFTGATFSFSMYPAAMFTAPRPVTSACAGAAVYARALLEELGGFDEDFFLLLEDVDLSLRARHKGETILLLPGARVLHKGSATIGGAIGQIGMYYGTRNHPWLLLKNFPAVTLLKCLPGLALIHSVRLLQSLRQGSLPILLRAWFASLRMVPRMLRKRREILGRSRLGRKQFEALLRKGWLRERRMFKQGRYDIPLNGMAKPPGRGNTGG